MNRNKLNNEKNVIEMLNYLVKRDHLNVDDVLKELDDMRRDTILKQHKENYKVWLAEDGRWKTKLPDGSKYGSGRWDLNKIPSPQSCIERGFSAHLYECNKNIPILSARPFKTI